ncbi:interleukin-20-like [Hemicordylus capensis]|uniref:interleukin-20-like n=1 Tax=Hemicordylus capensis TaxID=884348 RepID=UPI002302B101|nr:interleukin-20-like [Hemicordylus capensis]XP_053105974.1 interleukin-20-like [Hemicordylus capensis]
MMNMGPVSCLVILLFLFGKTVTTESRNLNFGQCELSGVSFQELRNYFGAIKQTVQTQDNRTEVVLLKESVLLEVPLSESCCLLRHLLRFYVERVFRHYEATSNMLRRKTSTLANAFLSIKTNLRVCHDQNKCACGEESHRRHKVVLEEYEKLEKNIAAVKALGEMDVLFAWMENIRN